MTPVLYKSAALHHPKIGKEVIKLIFPWDSLHLSQIKEVLGRAWHKEHKYWTIPLTLQNCVWLKESGYIMHPDLKAWANKAYKLSKTPITDLIIPNFKCDLKPYQKGGIIKTVEWNGRILIADEMGLGKTVQALGYLQLNPTLRPAIVVCPATLKFNWQNEANKWMDNPNTHILSGTKVDGWVYNDIIIINYNILSFWVKYLKTLKPQVIILDESHYIKNPSTKRSKAVTTLCKGVPHVLALSGTPIENRPLEIYTTINLLHPALFPSAWKFKHKYCGAKHNGFGWDFNGASNIEELYRILTENVMIRRKKKDVLTELPDKTYTFVPLEITNRSEYNRAEKDFKKYMMDSVEVELKTELQQFMKKYEIEAINFGGHELQALKEEKAEKATALAQIEILKQLAVKGKIAACMEWIEDFLESGEKLVVFCEHIFIIDMLMHHFGKIAVKIDGSVSMKNRNEAVVAFQNSKKIKLFVGNAAAEVGITLTAASNVAVLEYPWAPGKLAQRIDRVHRITQKNAVGVYYLMALNTIEEKIATMLDSKQRVLDGLLDGKETLEVDLFSELINEYKN